MLKGAKRCLENWKRYVAKWLIQESERIQQTQWVWFFSEEETFFNVNEPAFFAGKLIVFPLPYLWDIFKWEILLYWNQEMQKTTFWDLAKYLRWVILNSQFLKKWIMIQFSESWDIPITIKFMSHFKIPTKAVKMHIL